MLSHDLVFDTILELRAHDWLYLVDTIHLARQADYLATRLYCQEDGVPVYSW